MKYIRNILKYTLLFPLYFRKKKNDIYAKINELNKRNFEFNEKLNYLKCENENLKNQLNNLYVYNQIQIFEICKSLIKEKNNKLFFNNLPVIFDNKIRFVQLVDIEILKEFNDFCRKHNILFWLDAGTLLGALRSKKIIPWDDDIDTVMTREEFNKFKSVLSKNKNVSLILRENYIHFDNCESHIQYRLYLKNMPKCCFIDIFLLDYVDQNISNNFKEFIQYRNDFGSSLNSIYDCNVFKRLLSDKLIEFNKLYNKNRSKQYLVWGIDNYIDDAFIRGKHLHRYDDIFPLNEIEFENNKYFCPKNVIKYLEGYYGNFYDLPDDLLNHRHEYISDEDFEKIKEYLNNNHLIR